MTDLSCRVGSREHDAATLAHTASGIRILKELILRSGIGVPCHRQQRAFACRLQQSREGEVGRTGSEKSLASTRLLMLGRGQVNGQGGLTTRFSGWA